MKRLGLSANIGQRQFWIRLVPAPMVYLPMAYLPMFPARSRGCESRSRSLRRILVASHFEAVMPPVTPNASAGTLKSPPPRCEATALLTGRSAPGSIPAPGLFGSHGQRRLNRLREDERATAPVRTTPSTRGRRRASSISHWEYPLRSPCVSSSTVIARSRFFLFFFFPYFFYFCLFF